MTSDNSLLIEADSGDTVHFDTVNDSWSKEGTSDKTGYEQYTDGVVDVYITDTSGITIDGVA